jgi:hypothetical protein
MVVHRQDHQLTWKVINRRQVGLFVMTTISATQPYRRCRISLSLLNTGNTHGGLASQQALFGGGGGEAIGLKAITRPFLVLPSFLPSLLLFP